MFTINDEVSLQALIFIAVLAAHERLLSSITSIRVSSVTHMEVKG